MRSFRAQIRERGFALITALVVAALYFGLIQLVLMESILAYRQARGVSRRTALHILAEDGVELVTRDFCSSSGATATLETEEGKVEARSRLLGNDRFIIESVAVSGSGTAKVKLEGRFNGCTPIIESARYEP